jgi:phosphocarrier,  HPr family
MERKIMKEIIVEIKNEQGVHARPAALIVNIAKKYEITLEIEKVGENEIIDGKNVMGVMMLGAAEGEKLNLRTISENENNIEEENKLLEELRQLIEVDKFFEK